MVNIEHTSKISFVWSPYSLTGFTSLTSNSWSTDALSDFSTPTRHSHVSPHYTITYKYGPSSFITGFRIFHSHTYKIGTWFHNSFKDHRIRHLRPYQSSVRGFSLQTKLFHDEAPADHLESYLHKPVHVYGSYYRKSLTNINTKSQHDFLEEQPRMAAYNTQSCF